MQISIKVKNTYAASSVISDTGSGNDTPMLILGVRNTIRLRISPTTDYSAITGWKLFLTDDYSSETPTLFRTFSGITVNGGEIVADVILDSEPLRQFIGDEKEKELIFGVAGYNGIDEAPALLFQFPVTLLNNADIDGTVEVSLPESEYYSKIQVDAKIISAQLPDKWPVPVEPLKYTDTIGYYAELLNPGDTVKSVYNVFDCGMAGVRIFSANPAVSGNITVKINHQKFTFFINGEAQWVEMVLNQAVDGVLTVELVKGLSDTDGSPVSILITAATVSGAMNISSTARTAKQIAAKPLLYSDTLSYYHLLDDNYLIEPCYRAENLTAVILKVRSANPEISGNAAIKITVGETVKSAVIPIGTEDTAAVVTLDTPASGVIKIERDTASSDDTLKDGGATVSVIIRDIQYNYVEE